MSLDDKNTADQSMALEIISDLLISINLSELGQKLTEQLREITGAQTVMLVEHQDNPHTDNLLNVSPIRRSNMFSNEEINFFCYRRTPEELPVNTDRLSEKHPLYYTFQRENIKSILRFPLVVGGQQIGLLLLFNLSELSRINETREIINLFSRVIALSLKNAISHNKIEKQAEELAVMTANLEQIIIDRTKEIKNTNEELKIANEELKKSRYSALNLMEDAVESKKQSEKLAEELQKHQEQLELLVEQRTTELKIERDKAEQASQSKSTFLANMSHELRSPLNTIIGMSEALLEEVYGSLSEKQKISLGSIIASGSHLLNLINDILDISKIEAGKLELEYTEIKIQNFVNYALNFIKQQAYKKEISVSTDFQTNIDSFYCDERKLLQMLINLLSNAIKFTNKNGQIGVDVKHIYETNMLEFTVWDSGIGISSEDQGKLFQPFVQLDSGYNRKYQGTGLGLALVSKLADQLGGSVTVESETNKGSSFRLILPLSAENNQPATLQAKITVKDKSSDEILFIDKTILVADDDYEANQTLSDYLQSIGLTVVSASNGLETIKLYKAVHPDLIITDIHMPILDGIAMTKEIRKLNTAIPIFVVTAYAMENEKQLCSEAGADIFIRKPIKLSDLAEKIRNQFQKTIKP